MAGQSDLGERFEGPDEEDFEIELIPEGQADEVVDDGKVTLTKEQFEELNRGRDSSTSLASEFKALAAELKRTGQPVNVPVQQRGETDDEFEARIEAELYKPGNTGKTLKQVFDRYSGGLVASMQQELADLRRQMNRVGAGSDAPLYEKYGSEVDALINTLPPAQRAQAGAHQWALNQVKAKHMDEIIAEREAAAVAKALAKQQAGGDEDDLDNQPARPGAVVRGNAPFMTKGNGVAAVGQRQKVSVRPTAADYAAAKGAYMTISEYMTEKLRRQRGM